MGRIRDPSSGMDYCPRCDQPSAAVTAGHDVCVKCATEAIIKHAVEMSANKEKTLEH